jgi:L-alanine-DL-glutamate epimerase-like enolase superfamily enzyme
VPVFADEALVPAENLGIICREKLAHGVGLKIFKHGGISPTLQVLKTAKDHCMQLMLGCNTETTLSISAALQVALAHPEIEHIDLDGHLLLQNNPLAMVATDTNKLSPLAAGLGPAHEVAALFAS